jgi:hypothetical protein
MPNLSPYIALAWSATVLEIRGNPFQRWRTDDALLEVLLAHHVFVAGGRHPWLLVDCLEKAPNLRFGVW